MGIEQRRQKRVRLDLPVRIHLLTGDDSHLEPFGTGKLHDLSAGGCAFHYHQEIPIGTRVEVQIELDENLTKKFQKPVLTARGAICRIEKHEGKEYLLSVRFFK